MWQREVFLLLCKINYNIFELHYSLQEELMLKKGKQMQENNMQKGEQKVKLRNGLLLYL